MYIKLSKWILLNVQYIKLVIFKNLPFVKFVHRFTQPTHMHIICYCPASAKVLSNKLLLSSEKEYRRSSHRDPFYSQDLLLSHAHIPLVNSWNLIPSNFVESRRYRNLIKRFASVLGWNITRRPIPGRDTGKRLRDVQKIRRAIKRNPSSLPLEMIISGGYRCVPYRSARWRPQDRFDLVVSQSSP